MRGEKLLKRSLCEALDACKLHENLFRFCTLSTSYAGNAHWLTAYAARILLVLCQILNQLTNTQITCAASKSDCGPFSVDRDCRLGTSGMQYRSNAGRFILPAPAPTDKALQPIIDWRSAEPELRHPASSQISLLRKSSRGRSGSSETDKQARCPSPPYL